VDHAEGAAHILTALVAGESSLRRSFTFSPEYFGAPAKACGSWRKFDRGARNQIRVVEFSLAKLGAM
jgi:hypothetical protein